MALVGTFWGHFEEEIELKANNYFCQNSFGTWW